MATFSTYCLKVRVSGFAITTIPPTIVIRTTIKVAHGMAPRVPLIFLSVFVEIMFTHFYLNFDPEVD